MELIFKQKLRDEECGVLFRLIHRTVYCDKLISAAPSGENSILLIKQALQNNILSIPVFVDENVSNVYECMVFIKRQHGRDGLIKHGVKTKSNSGGVMCRRRVLLFFLLHFYAKSVQ